MDETLGSLIARAKSPICLLGRNGECTLVSEGFRTLLLSDKAPNDVSEFWPSHHLAAGEGWRGVSVFECRDGSSKEVVIVATPVAEGWILTAEDSSGGSSGQVASNSVRGERLATLGMLAGGVAHDFNNVLTGILGHISFLKSILPRTGQHSESVLAIEEGARRGSAMTQQILNFSKAKHEDKPQSIDLVGLIKGTSRLLKGAVPAGCSLEFLVPERSIHVLAVEVGVTQILINLVVNARDAVPAQGKIFIELNVVSDAVELDGAFNGSDLSSKSYAKISVIDNGHGMSEDVRRRMFEPYFSTKKAFGTGLGLATVHQTVKQFGGAIAVDSEVGRGTKISVYLPVIGEDPNTELPRVEDSAATRVEGGKPRILIVDDEYPVRNVLCVSLEHLGYDVEVASSGAEAVQKLEDSDRDFDLVILDMIMPGMSGDKVFFKLREIQKGIRVLVISGYSSESAVQSILDHGGLDFMAKPFTIEELSKKVQRCLAIKVGV